MPLPIGKTGVKRISRPRVQKVETVPAPVQGINARDSLAAMPPTSAVSLINWIPQRYGVRGRKGYSEWATGLGAQVNTVMSFFSPGDTIPTTSNFQTAPTTLPGKVFAATDANIYEITTAGAVGAAAQALSGTTNAGYLSNESFANSAGGWLLCCSEIDGYFTYNGAAWVKVTLGAGATQVSVSDPTKFCAVAIWKRRAWFVIKSTAKVAYLPVDSVYGAAAELDLGPLLRHGGAIAWISTWTIDAGTGIDDMLVICSENGDVVIYKGTDPSSASTFALVGVFYCGEVPKGRNGFITLGGDLLIISNLGIIPVSYITRGGANVLGVATGNITADISQLFSADIAVSFNKFGWHLEPAPREDLLIAVVPQTPTTVNLQYVMNTSSNHWCQFNGMPMTCLKSVANWPLFGAANGTVYIAFVSYLDNVLLNGTGGVAIPGSIQTAFNYFQKEGEISQNKHFLMVQPTFLSPTPPGVTIQVNVDFNNALPVATPVPGTISGSAWDTAAWGTAVWGGAMVAYKKWTSVVGYGRAGQASIRTVVNDDTTLISLDYMMELGGQM